MELVSFELCTFESSYWVKTSQKPSRTGWRIARDSRHNRC